MSMPASQDSSGPGKITAAVRYIAQSFNSLASSLDQIDPTKTGYRPGVVSIHTVNYTAVQADNGTVINLSGNTFYSFSLAAPAGYTAPYTVNVFNSSTRGKSIIASGQPTFILWPGQACDLTLDAVGAVWLVDRPGAWKPDTGQTFFVDPVNGNDGNDGLAAGLGNAFLTIQAAVDNIHINYDAENIPPTIQLQDGTHNVGDEVFINYVLRGSAELFIIGNLGTPSSVVVSCNAGGTCFSCQEPATVTLSHMTLSTAGNGSTGVFCRQMTTVDLDNIIFSSFPLGIFISITTHGSCNFLGDMASTGNASSAITVGDNAHLNCTSFTWTASAAAIDFFLDVSNNSVVEAGMSFVDLGVVGQKYVVANLSILNSNGSVFPGNIAGSPVAGSGLDPTNGALVF